jgi:hypothetical protein
MAVQPLALNGSQPAPADLSIKVVEDIETLREWIGAAVTLAPLRDAYEMGFRVGALQSSKVAIPLYRQLGFQDICKIGLYRWERMIAS